MWGFLFLLLCLLRLLGFSALVVGYVVDCEVEFCCGAGEHGWDWWRGREWEGLGGLDWIGLDWWMDREWGEYGRIGGM